MTIRNGLSPIHPGEFLKEALDELGTCSLNSPASSGFRPCGFPMSSMARGRLRQSLRFSSAAPSDTTPQYWLDLQAAYDLKIAEQEIRGRLRVMRPLAQSERRGNKGPDRPLSTPHPPDGFVLQRYRTRTLPVSPSPCRPINMRLSGVSACRN